MTSISFSELPSSCYMCVDHFLGVGGWRGGIGGCSVPLGERTSLGGQGPGSFFSHMHRLMDEPLNSLCLGKAPQTYPRMQWSGTRTSPFYFGHLSALLSDVSLSLRVHLSHRRKSDDTLITSQSGSSVANCHFGIS